MDSLLKNIYIYVKQHAFHPLHYKPPFDVLHKRQIYKIDLGCWNILEDDESKKWISLDNIGESFDENIDEGIVENIYESIA